MGTHLFARRIVLVAIVLVTAVALWWAGNAPLAASNVHDYPYNETINVGEIISDSVAVSLAEVARTGFSDPLAFPIGNVGIIATAAAMALLAASSWRRTWMTFTVAGLSAPLGLLGLIAFVGPYDGELIEEGWTSLAVWTPWSLFLVGFAFYLSVTDNRDDQASAATSPIQ